MLTTESGWYISPVFGDGNIHGLPVIHYGILSLLYRFLAAIAQPVSEKRIVDSLATMGEGCALLLRILFTAEILCILDFVILMTGIGGSG